MAQPIRVYTDKELEALARVILFVEDKARSTLLALNRLRAQTGEPQIDIDAVLATPTRPSHSAAEPVRETGAAGSDAADLQ